MGSERTRTIEPAKLTDEFGRICRICSKRGVIEPAEFTMNSVSVREFDLCRPHAERIGLTIYMVPINLPLLPDEPEPIFVRIEKDR